MCATAGAALASTGDILPLPGLPGHDLLAPGSGAVTAAIDRLPGGYGPTTFLCPSPSDPGPDSHVKVTALACPTQSPHQLVAVLLVSPPGELYGLTSRELEILGLIVDGWPNQRMASALLVTERTVAAHVEHILAKLGAETRTLAAVRAVRLGLYVPRPLNGVAADSRALVKGAAR